VTGNDWLLMLHIASAFLLVGGSVAAGILNWQATAAERPSDAAALLRLIRLVLPLVYAGTAGTLVFGLWLWHRLGFSLGTGWIWASLVLWVVMNALGGIGGRHQERSRELAERLAAEGDAPNAELRALLRDPTGTAVSYAAGLATLAILVLMIWKP
jgi:uncharacterized membrane protein